MNWKVFKISTIIYIYSHGTPHHVQKYRFIKHEKLVTYCYKNDPLYFQLQKQKMVETRFIEILIPSCTYYLKFTPRNFIIANLSIRKPGSSSVLIISECYISYIILYLFIVVQIVFKIVCVLYDCIVPLFFYT